MSLKQKKKNLFLIKSTRKFALGGIFIELEYKKINSNNSRADSKEASAWRKGGLASLVAACQHDRHSHGFGPSAKLADTLSSSCDKTTLSFMLVLPRTVQHEAQATQNGPM